MLHCRSVVFYAFGLFVPFILGALIVKVMEPIETVSDLAWMLIWVAVLGLIWGFTAIWLMMRVRRNANPEG